MSLTPTAAYTWVSGETVTATKLNTAGVPVIPDGQDYAFSLGTALLPSMAFNGDTNTGVYSPGADQWAVATAGVQRFSVTTTGLGITLPLTSTVTTGTAPFVVASTTNVANLNASSLNGATFAAPGAIGSTTPSTGAFTTLSATGAITSTVTAGLAFNASSATTGQIYQQFGSTGGTYYTGLENSAGSAFGATAYALFRYAPSGRVIQDMINGVVITSASATGLQVTGALSATGALSGQDLRQANDGFLTYDSGNVGSKSLTVRDGAGNTRAVFSSTGLAVTGQIGNSFTGANGQYALSSDNTSSANFHVFYNSASVAIGSINRVTTTNAVSYNTTSDRRIKENFGLLTDSGRLIDSLTPRTFDRKDGTDDDRKGWLGFVAQEVHAADPVFARIGFVTVGDDDPTEVTKTWGVSSSPIDALLVAEIQSLRARVAMLEAA